jgi:N-acetylglucosaminyldiphosphoundecaprenol N-acetyl-beta-D-mannosaminyltransferase
MVSVATQPALEQTRQTLDILGTNVDLVQIPSAIERIEGWIQRGERGQYVTLTNVHAVTEAHRDPRFKQVLNDASMVCPDGMPLIWLARMRGFRLKRRVYGPDLMWEFFRATEHRGYTHFLYGGKAETLDALLGEINKHFPDVRIAGSFSPPFRAFTDEEHAEVVDLINEACPDVLWVGLGCPKQEYWMHEHQSLLTAGVMLGVGQAFDIHAGNLRQAPRWMQEHGLEWLFRLCLEPRRLWRRYLVYNTNFVLALTRELLIGK